MTEETEAAPVPVHFSDVINRLNTGALRTRCERLIYQSEKQVWRLVSLDKARPLTIPQIERLARDTKAIEDFERVVGA